MWPAPIHSVSIQTSAELVRCWFRFQWFQAVSFSNYNQCVWDTLISAFFKSLTSRFPDVTSWREGTQISYPARGQVSCVWFPCGLLKSRFNLKNICYKMELLIKSRFSLKHICSETELLINSRFSLKTICQETELLIKSRFSLEDFCYETELLIKWIDPTGKRVSQPRWCKGNGYTGIRKIGTQVCCVLRCSRRMCTSECLACREGWLIARLGWARRPLYGIQLLSALDNSNSWLVPGSWLSPGWSGS